MEPRNFEAILYDIESLIRSGDSDRSVSRLRKIRSGKIPRRHVRKVAELLRRAGLVEDGLSLLQKLVNGTSLEPASASVPEQAEYAACLERVGALNETRRRLSSLSTLSFNRLLLYGASLEIAQWDYSAAIPLLKAFISESPSNEYDTLVASVNLAAALTVVGDMEQANETVRQTLAQVEPRYARLTGNLHEIQAQIDIELGNYSKARDSLSKARQILSPDDRDGLYVLKWKAIVDHSEERSDETRESLRSVRTLAEKSGLHEVVRDCDRHLVLIDGDTQLFLYLFFGTPHEAFRTSLLGKFSSVRIPDAYPLRIGPGRDIPASCLDLSRVDPDRPGGKLKPGKLNHRLLLALTSDFYKPLSAVEVHNLLYPDELYNMESTPTKIHQAVKSLRQWLKREFPDIEITFNKGAYSLASETGSTVSCLSPQLSQEAAHYYERRLSELFGIQGFSAVEAGRAIGLTSRQATVYLKQLAIEGRISVEGAGSATHYQLCSTLKRAG